MRLSAILLSICFLLSNCDYKSIRYHGYRDLGYGKQELKIFDDLSFSICLGVGDVHGTCTILGDSIFLHHDNKQGIVPKKAVKTDSTILLIMPQSPNLIIERKK